MKIGLVYETNLEIVGGNEERWLSQRDLEDVGDRNIVFWKIKFYISKCNFSEVSEF